MLFAQIVQTAVTRCVCVCVCVCMLQMTWYRAKVDHVVSSSTHVEDRVYSLIYEEGGSKEIEPCAPEDMNKDKDGGWRFAT